MMDEARKNTLEALRKIHGDNAPGVTKAFPECPDENSILPYVLGGVLLGMYLGTAIGMMSLLEVQLL